jgi:hypothetical protein
MEKRKKMIVLLVSGLVAWGGLSVPAIGQKTEVGYRRLFLGNTMAQIKQCIADNFGSGYTTADDGSGTLVLSKLDIDKPIILITMLFDQNNILYKINVKINKIPGNPQPEEVTKSIEEKYGPPSKKDISKTLDFLIYWHLNDNRYEIFFQNIASWDKYDVRYTDIVLQKQKENYDKEMNKKPKNKELDF